MTAASQVGLYPISPPHLSVARLEAGLTQIAEAAADIRHPVCFQLWLADDRETELPLFAEKLLPIARDAEIAFIINGDPEIAASLDCDGVHLNGPSREDIAQARNLLGDDAIIGAACGASRHQAMVAAEAGVDYVSFGPIYRSETKSLDANPEAAETLMWWAEMMEVPCVAVGGIAPGNTAETVSMGADFLAVIGALWDHPGGPGNGLRAFADAIDK